MSFLQVNSITDKDVPKLSKSRAVKAREVVWALFFRLATASTAAKFGLVAVSVTCA
jgi:hypothetical protein